MTARGVYEAILIELSKINAPALKLHEFNYLCNKAINQFINEVYNIYDVTQQTTDDIRVLKSTAYLTPTKVELKYPMDAEGEKDELHFTNAVIPTVDADQTSNRKSKIKLPGATYEIYMPQDYLHLLNCVCIYYVAQQNKCYDAGDYIEVPAKRLTADAWSSVINDIYNRPSPLNPYYYLHNRNQYNTLPTNPIYKAKPAQSSTKPTIEINGTDITSRGFDGTQDKVATFVNNDTASQVPAASNFNRTITLNDAFGSKEISVVEKPTAVRVSNPTTVRCEIRYGMDDTVYQLVEVQVEYLKSPQFIRLTQEQLDRTTDISQIMEFPDYICQEIINKLVTLLMERAQDPRLANNIQINRTIARPTEQQSQQTNNQAQ